VDAVIDYYEAHALYARRGCEERGKIDTEGLVAAAFDHRTSRAGDPLLHTHVVTANLTLTAEGKWQAIDGRPVYDHAKSGGFLYQAHLRHTLAQTLGLRFEKVRNGWAEVQGVPREVIRAFSKRRDEIEDLVAETGYTSARAHQAATLASRAAKDYGVDSATLESRWHAEAAALDFGPEQVEACFGKQASVTGHASQEVFADLAGPHGLTCQTSTFARPDVIEMLSERLGSSAPAGRIEQLADAFLASPLVQPLAPAGDFQGDLVWRRGGHRERSADLARYSTPDLLELEDRLLTWAADGFGKTVPAASTGSTESALSRRPELSDEQAAMVRSVCGSALAIQPVAGRPGAGKTFATATCVEAFLDSGIPVVGCALSATAAGELETVAQLGRRTGRPASTIARLLIDLRDGGLPPGTVLIVDEASMVGTRDLARLAEHAAQAGGAIKLVGDPDQHGPVETGGFFRRLVTSLGDTVPHLVENNRQDDPDERAATEDYREDLIETALARYDAAGKITRSSTAAQSYDAMVADWYDGVCAGSGDPMVAGPNSVRHALNTRARARLKADGRLTGPAMVSTDREFLLGEWVVARRNAYHLRAADGSGFVKNGSSGRVVALDPQAGTLTVDFAVEGRIRLPATYVDAGWVEYAYARTTYGVQGATLQRALYHPGDASSFEEGYVALTRGKVETRIYLVDGALGVDQETGHSAHEKKDTGLDTVCQALERRRSKTLAHDADPTAASCRAMFQGWDLRELRVERERLVAVVAAAPPPVAAALEAANRRRDALLARRQVWTGRLNELEAGQSDRLRWLRRRSHAMTDNDTASVRRQLDAMERSIASIDGRLAGLRRRHEDREEYLLGHAPEVERLELVSRAEMARELQVRAGAITPEALTALVGREPHSAVERHALRDAAEQLAIHKERFGVLASEGNDPVAAVLGDRPGEPASGRSYDRAEEALREALVVDSRVPVAAEPLDLG
jgi:hypothetical protein